jgi:MOSC domain-containing protein YiiM
MRIEARVISVSARATHRISKDVKPSIKLIAGHGVEGDAHMGVTVKHRSRVARDPTQANLRQIHLIHAELLEELRLTGFVVEPAALGENILTAGINLLGLGTGARLRIGSHAVIEITGLRNPCAQIDGLQKGLMQAVLGRADDGSLIRKSGVMGIVIADGIVKPGDPIEIIRSDSNHRPLEPV